MKWFKPIRYRVVRDNYLGFEVQRLRWWWPLWLQVGINTFSSLDRAISYVERIKANTHVVWEG